MSAARHRPALETWKGDFGNAYTGRNAADEASIERRVRMWRRVLRPLEAAPPASCLEVGANVGINLRALKTLHALDMYALEPNAKARDILVRDRVVPRNRVLDGTADRIDLADESVDLVFTSGVLIHVPPGQLAAACGEMHRVARRYLLMIEYFASEPEEKTYRGEEGLLFKCDFGAFCLDLFPDLSPVDYGFFWKPATGLDNLTWWLFAKP
ncbi:MAG: methyltransferase domain-containing protein [Gammaproteobacteria bacterium]|nr:methyltransferase domain-containing protein [Gammaproteobacteria bacterium]